MEKHTPSGYLFSSLTLFTEKSSIFPILRIKNQAQVRGWGVKGSTTRSFEKKGDQEYHFLESNLKFTVNFFSAITKLFFGQINLFSGEERIFKF